MGSVLIAAHNEAAVIERCLHSVLAEANPGEFEVIVAANGCTDDTAKLASAFHGVSVLDLPSAGKAAALNAAERSAIRFPRVYLDADILISTAGLRRLMAALGSHPTDRPGVPVLATVPKRELELAGRPALVRAYFAINSHLPVFDGGLFGRGVIAVSEEGRSRFDIFPEVIADDLFLDSIFAPAEKMEVATVTSSIATPRRTADLLHRLVRVRRGNRQLRAMAMSPRSDVRPSDKKSWLADVVIKRPWLVPSAVVYVSMTMVAELLARRAPASAAAAWGRDESTRSHQTIRLRTDGQTRP